MREFSAQSRASGATLRFSATGHLLPVLGVFLFHGAFFLLIERSRVLAIVVVFFLAALRILPPSGHSRSVRVPPAGRLTAEGLYLSELRQPLEIHSGSILTPWFVILVCRHSVRSRRFVALRQHQQPEEWRRLLVLWSSQRNPGRPKMGARRP